MPLVINRFYCEVQGCQYMGSPEPRPSSNLDWGPTVVDHLLILFLLLGAP